MTHTSNTGPSAGAGRAPSGRGRTPDKVLAVAVIVAALVAVYFIVSYDGGEEVPGAEGGLVMAQPPAEAPADGVRLVTWNLYNFGGSKSDAEVEAMAEVLRSADLVAVQEVNTRPDGAQAVARLARALGRRGAQWDYAVSKPTTGAGSERYAYLWKPSRVRAVGRPWLAQEVKAPIDREPYLARFEHGASGRRLLVASFHAVPTAKRPADEVALLDRLHRSYAPDHLVLAGDFNLAEDHPAFDALKAAGYASALQDQRTSLRRARREEPGGHLASEYDNVFYERAPLRLLGAGAVDFTGAYATLREARTLSDHLPLYADIVWQP